MLGHVGSEHHINGHFAHRLSLFGTQTGENITAGVLEQLERYRQVVIFED